jgi:ribosome biogenesis protein ENP2
MANPTGTYKPQIHTHYLPHLSLSFARHTNCLNQTFLLLSSDYTKSLHLQSDRFLEFHTAGGLHYSTRIPRFGRDLVYDRHSAEALIPSVGVNPDGNGEVFRLNLEVGRFMRGYEVDVGGDDLATAGGGALQGGIGAGAVNTGAIAEESHNLLAFGTSLGTVEFWDSRSRNRVGILSAPQDAFEGHSEITALQFHRSGLELATGNSNGLIHLYDLRSPVPLLKKDQGYGHPSM